MYDNKSIASLTLTTPSHTYTFDSPLKTIDNGGSNAKFDLCGNYKFYVMVT